MPHSTIKPAPASSAFTLRPALAPDSEAILRIYQDGIDTGNATFTSAVPSWKDWSDAHLDCCRIVAMEKDAVVGWAALSPVSGRSVYAGVAEVSVYVAASRCGCGLGGLLLERLIKETEAHDIWTLQAGVFPENSASLNVHKKHGFRVVGIRERLGKMTYGPMAGKWRDLVLLERRSDVSGTD
ncbi:phosphinothricin acetyltransferase [Cohaesibacter sp. ES.047]|uniref:GNAT family N-acetyltransferase n=1 Tax=Cohaesibacter sp. ES.047 TaxID=1798205 RepID=UPI000BB6E517|nr:GNAT family N-acetyltransferase [Cohaesibacter sp. ES.047]SNY93053.1 phosphinothricin acetyltransferase [Cohaesibacter sp. ES.047]